MDVEKTKNLRLGITERVEYCASFERVSSGKSTTNFMPTAQSRM